MEMNFTLNWLVLLAIEFRLFFACTQTQDEYIHMKKIGKPPARNGNASGRDDNENGSKSSGLSKFDRYRHQDDDDDEMDEGSVLRFR